LGFKEIHNDLFSNTGLKFVRIPRICWSLGLPVVLQLQITFLCYNWIKIEIVTNWTLRVRWNRLSWDYYSFIGWSLGWRVRF
jgi:hypothetical protein